MSEAYREQRPLLCDDLSEEEHFSPLPRRFRPMVCVGRARSSAKGAAAIITRWPDHWSSSLSYWWIAIVMITITIFIVYNIIFAFALLPSTHYKPSLKLPMNKVQTVRHKIVSTLPEIYMHILVNSKDKVDLNKYLPHIRVISNKYAAFKYNLKIVLNDLSSESDGFGAEEHNEIAFNSLWSKEVHVEKSKDDQNNIIIEYISLSKYIQESPLRKHGRHLPPQFMEFLVRAISIWEKGGIALNPITLTTQSPHVIYIEKLEKLLQQYEKSNERKSNVSKIEKHKSKQKYNVKKKVNNIRDIIDILEHEDDNLKSAQYSLSEAENKNDVIVTQSGRKLLSVMEVNETKTESLSQNNIVHIKHSIDKNNITENFGDKLYYKTKFNHRNTSIPSNEPDNEQIGELHRSNKTSKLSLLPMFLEYLFRGNSNLKPKNNEEEPNVYNMTRLRKSVIPIAVPKRNNTNAMSIDANKTETLLHDKYSPMIISANGIVRKELKHLNITHDTKTNYDENQLTIDIKGNLLATETPCHAFIGTVFSNVIHHTAEESLQDFIISELSIFCKGLLSTCNGVDVILL